MAAAGTRCSRPARTARDAARASCCEEVSGTRSSRCCTRRARRRTRRGSSATSGPRIRIEPRGVDERLAPPGNAIAACPEETINEFDFGLSRRKAIYMRLPRLLSRRCPAIDWRTCTKCGKCVAAVGGKGINLDEPAARDRAALGRHRARHRLRPVRAALRRVRLRHLPQGPHAAAAQPAARPRGPDRRPAPRQRAAGRSGSASSTASARGRSRA